MKKEIITRREAIGRMAWITGSLVLGPSLLEFGSELLGKDVDALAQKDMFFIRRIGEALIDDESFRFDTQKACPEKLFRIYSIVHPGHPLSKGFLRLKHSEDTLTVGVTRNGSFGHHQYISIEQSVSGKFCEPSEWRYNSRLASKEDMAPLYGQPTEGRGKRVSDRMEIEEKNNVRRFDLKTKICTLTWNLFEAIGDIAGRVDGRYDFDTIDEYDMYGGVKRLLPFKSAEIDVLGTKYRLKGWVVTGDATLPLFFWLNESGTLLFANSGMVVYVRES